MVVWVVGDQIINGSESGESFRQALYFKSLGFKLHDTMIYHKINFANPEKVRYHQLFEYMFVFSKGSPKTFNPIKDKENTYAGKSSMGKNTGRQTNGDMKERTKKIVNPLGMRSNVWKMNTAAQENPCQPNLHPAQFPEALARDHILSWSNPGDTVLDPMMGSGTTIEMAHLLNRKAIGCDMSEEYVQLSIQRVSQEVMTI